MKLRLLFLMFVCTELSAEPEILPPIVDISEYPQQQSHRKKAPVKPMFEILERLEQLQMEVQELRGQVEEQAYLIEKLDKKQGSMYSDLDERLQKAENGGKTDKSSVGALATGKSKKTKQ